MNILQNIGVTEEEIKRFDELYESEFKHMPKQEFYITVFRTVAKDNLLMSESDIQFIINISDSVDTLLPQANK